MNDDDTAVDSSLRVTHIAGGGIVDVQSMGTVIGNDFSSAIYETSSESNENDFITTFDQEETDTNDEGNNVFVGNLIAVDEDISDDLTLRLEGEVSVEAGVDLDDVSVSVFKNENGQWQYEMSGNFNALASGESATVTFQYVADDGHGFDGTDGINESSVSEPKTVTLTVMGTNDQPIISDIILVAEEALNGNNTFAGTLVASDDDTHDTHEFFGVLDEEESIAYEVDSDADVSIESITVNTNGTYSVVGDFNALAVGESATVTFQYYAVDSSETQENGESNTSEIKTVTMTITGTNDQPVIENVDANGDGISGEVTYTTEIGASIYDYHTTLSPITIADSGIIQDLNVKINLTHSYDNDLNIGLIAPNGTYISLAYHLGGGGNNYSDTVFDDEASMSISSGYAPFSGTFSPQGLLSTFDDLEMQGTWTLQIIDEVGIDSGYLYSWSLIIDSDGGQKVYESMSEALPATVDVLTTFEGVLPLVTDDDTSDTHTYRLDGSVDVDNTLVTDLSVVVNEDGSYVIEGNFNTLAAGESATVTFQYVADDGKGFDGSDGINENSISAPAMVTLTITGTNDQPVVENITVTSQNEALDGINTFTGTLIANDEDSSDAHNFFMSGDASVDNELVSGLSVSLTESGVYTVTGDFNALAAGESATVTFQYYAVDDSDVGSGDTNNESSISEIKTVTMTIIGTNDQPLVRDVVTTVNEIALADTRSHEDFTYEGQLTVTDNDMSNTHTFSIQNNSLHVSITTIDADGIESTMTLPSWAVNLLVWTHQLEVNLNADTGEYTISSTLFNTLGSNQSMNVSFNYVANDGTGFDGTDGTNETSQSNIATATLVVQGTNDQPTAFSDSATQWEQLLVNTPSEDALFTGRVPSATDEDNTDNIRYIGVDANNDGFVDVQATGPLQNTDGTTPVVDPS